MSPSDKLELEKYAKQTSVDLDKLKVHELKDILRLIKKCTYSMDCPKKYRGFDPLLGGIKKDLVKRLSKPDYKTDVKTNKNKTIQDAVVGRIFDVNLADPNETKKLSHEGWTKIPNTSGQDISDWCFSKPVVEDILKQIYPKGEGNPFTFFKIDDRTQASHAFWSKDIRIAYKQVGGKLLLGFERGFLQGFLDFNNNNRDTHNYDPNTPFAVLIEKMEFAKESTSEAHNFTIIWHLFKEELLKFFGIPPNSELISKGAHRMRSEDIGQVELDFTIAWAENGSQGRILIELKGNRNHSSGWDGGFSVHQFTRPYELVLLRTSKHKLPVEIKSVFCRFEKDATTLTWNAKLDLYEMSQGRPPIWKKGIDFLGIPE